MEPLEILTVGYIIGIVWGLYLKISIVPILFLCIGALLLYKRKIKATLLWYLVIAIILAFISNIQINTQENKFNNLYNGLDEIKVVRNSCKQCKS